ncbi:MAG: MFS transporter, partial [Desulfobacteraceae bacterium]|nr:MFS transporter [Desulfobacteraceae bacterium]
PFFYGWLVLASAFAILFLVQGSRAIIGVTFKPIIDEFAWSREPISLAVFLNMTVFALAMPLAGRYYDRYGARLVIFLSSLLIAIGFIGLTLIDSLPGFLFFYGILTAIGFGGTSVPLFAAVISHWFDSHRGFAVSLALAGGCIGHYFVVLASTHAVVLYSWRTAFLICGILIFLVGGVMAVLVIRNRPSDMGLFPYRRKESPRDGDEKTPIHPTEKTAGLSLAEAMKTRSFWLFTTVMFVCGGGDFLVLTHLVPMVTDFGIPARTAGDMLAWFGLLSFVGVLAAGRAIDLIGNKIPIVVTFLFRFFLFVMVLKYQTVVSFYIFALGFGFTQLITAPITTTLLVKLYGFPHIGFTSGFITTIHHFGGGLWVWWAGIIFDHTGDYRATLLAYAAAAMLASMCGLLIREKRHYSISR